MSTSIVKPAKAKPPALSAGERRSLDAFADELCRHWLAAENAMRSMAEVAVRLLDAFPDVVNARGAAYAYLEEKLGKKNLSARRLFDVIRAGRIRSEVKGLPGPCPYFDQLTIDQMILVEPVLPNKREPFARDIIELKLTRAEIIERLIAENWIDGEGPADPDEVVYKHAVALTRKTPEELAALQGEERKSARAALKRLAKIVAERLDALAGK